MADKKHRFHVIILAAGDGTRLGKAIPKQYLALGGRSILAHSIEKFTQIENCANIIVVYGELHAPHLVSLPDAVHKIVGGKTRCESVSKGLAALGDFDDDEIVLIHDAARPLVSVHDILSCYHTALHNDAATLATPIADTLYRQNEGPVKRDDLWAIQTPQAFKLALIREAHRLIIPEAIHTDDAGLVRAIGHDVSLVTSTSPNFKITTAEDLIMAEAVLAQNTHKEYRTGLGYDVHAFDPDERDITSIRLCGIDVPYHRRLAGHSDADVGLHALTDAILGAIGEGDIGLHFPPSDMTFKDMDSAIFLRHALKLMKQKGGALVNADVTLICEKPKVGPHRESIRNKLAELLELPYERVNIKATTTEKLGFTGREEGIASQAIVSIAF